MKTNTKKWILIVVASLFAFVPNGPVTSQSSSPNFIIEESSIGPGGIIDSTSPNFQLRASLGDTGVGNSTSSNFQLWGGYTTTADPYIEFVVNSATIDFGTLSSASTATGNATFYVRSYLSEGYVVTTESAPPANGSATLAPITSQAASAAGTEQFGINLEANTSPATFGANPSQFPDSSFGFGFAASGYDTANQYQYNNGDTIAQSNSSSGRTDYTISYVVNIAELTEGGVYTMDHTLVATATY